MERARWNAIRFLDLSRRWSLTNTSLSFVIAHTYGESVAVEARDMSFKTTVLCKITKDRAPWALHGLDETK